jgi:hypothetical protein
MGSKKKKKKKAGLSFLRHVGNAWEGQTGNSILKGAEADEDKDSRASTSTSQEAKKFHRGSTIRF